MPKNRKRKVIHKAGNHEETHREGVRRELTAARKLVEEGFNVSFPAGSYRYDLLAEKHPRYYRIQVKPLKLQYRKDPHQPLSINQWVIHAYTTPKGKKKTYSKKDTDVVFAVDLESNAFAIVPVDEIPSSGVVRMSEKTKRARYLNSFVALE